MEAVNAAKGVLQGMKSQCLSWLFFVEKPVVSPGVKKRPISELELSTARRTGFTAWRFGAELGPSVIFCEPGRYCVATKLISKAMSLELGNS